MTDKLFKLTHEAIRHAMISGRTPLHWEGNYGFAMMVRTHPSTIRTERKPDQPMMLFGLAVTIDIEVPNGEFWLVSSHTRGPRERHIVKVDWDNSRISD